MRAFLQLGFIALALAATARAGAQDRRRAPRQTTVVVGGGPVVRESAHDWRTRSPHRAHALADARRCATAQRRDLVAILRITSDWTIASRRGDLHMMYRSERRADAWVEREIAESIGRPDRGRYVFQLRVLRRDLHARHRRRGHGRQHGRLASKSRALDGLVELAERDARQARLQARRHVQLAFRIR